jgi:hypothetical protein
MTRAMVVVGAIVEVVVVGWTSVVTGGVVDGAEVVAGVPLDAGCERPDVVHPAPSTKEVPVRSLAY